MTRPLRSARFVRGNPRWSDALPLLCFLVVSAVVLLLAGGLEDRGEPITTQDESAEVNHSEREPYVSYPVVELAQLVALKAVESDLEENEGPPDAVGAAAPAYSPLLCGCGAQEACFGGRLPSATSRAAAVTGLPRGPPV